MEAVVVTQGGQAAFRGGDRAENAERGKGRCPRGGQAEDAFREQLMRRGEGGVSSS